jgi:4'-phosphopantetheinyl transferase EntD
MISKILPRDVTAVECFVTNPTAFAFHEEIASLGAVGEKRLQEFKQARHCAHLAVNKLGLMAIPIPRISTGEPLWPNGVCGSITHCPGYTTAVVALRSTYVSLGVDAEENRKLESDVLDLVLLPEESKALGRVNVEDRGARGCLLFCAKESVYKALFPLTREWLEFGDVAIEIDPEHACFHATLRTPRTVGLTSLSRLSGRYLIANKVVLAFVAIPARRCAS